MNKSKTKKLALLTTVAILVLCFVPAVAAVKTSNNSINIRDIEDWLWAGNPYGSSPGFLDPDSMLIQRCWADSVYDAESFEGYIVEKLLKDGSLHYTVKIKVEGMPMAIRDLNLPGAPWVFFGLMDYRYTSVFILEEEIPGGPARDWDYGPYVTDSEGNPAPLIETLFVVPADIRGPGADLPAWWVLYFYPHIIGGHFVKMEFQSKGSGFFDGSGEEANVKCHQVAIYGNNLPLDNPLVNQFTAWSVPEGVFEIGGELQQSPLLMPEMWPVEYVTFY